MSTRCKVNPEIYIIEDAESLARARRLHLILKGLRIKVFRGHGLTSRLKGDRWNRRDPSITIQWSVWALGSEGRLKHPCVNG